MVDSPYPDYIPLRTGVWGRSLQMETTRPLRIETTTKASRSLIWEKTGERFFPAGEVRRPPVGIEAVMEVPVTDLLGWIDPETGNPIDPDAGPTHTYITTVRVYDGDRLVDTYSVGPYSVPTDPDPFDGDLLRFNGLAPAAVPVPPMWDLSGGADFPPQSVEGDWGIDITDGVTQIYRNGGAMGKVLASRINPFQVVYFGVNLATPRPDAATVLWQGQFGAGVPAQFRDESDMVWYGEYNETIPGWDLSTVPGLTAHFDARTLDLADGANVTSWPNLIAGRTPAVPIDSIPTMKTDGINGHKSVRFPNQGVLRDTGYAPYAGEHNVFIVAKATDATTTDFVFDATDAAGTALKAAIGRNATNWIIQRGTSVVGRSADGTAVLLHARFDAGTTGSLTVNDGTPATGALAAPIAVDRYTYGGRADNGNKLSGDIGEIIIIRGAVSETNRAQITAMMLQGWDLIQPWALSQVPDLACDFNAESLAGVVADGASVSGHWVDPVSGKTATHISSPSATYDADGFNGKPTVAFPNGGALQVTGFDGYTGPWTLFLLAQSTAPADADFFIDAVDGGGAPLKLGVGYQTNAWRIQRSTAVSGGVTDTDPHLFEAVFNGASSSLRVDDDAAITGATTDGQGFANIILGGRGGDTNRLTGKISRVIGIQGIVSSTDRAEIRAMLKTQGGLS